MFPVTNPVRDTNGSLNPYRKTKEKTLAVTWILLFQSENKRPQSENKRM